MRPRAIVLFVYGTLRRGEPSHELLRSAEPLGEAITPPRFDLVDLGPYPALVRGGATSVRGELYLVGAEALVELDRFEGHPELYRRGRIALAGDGETRRAQAYLLGRRRAAGRPRIACGDWCAWRKTRSG